MVRETEHETGDCKGRVSGKKNKKIKTIGLKKREERDARMPW